MSNNELFFELIRVSLAFQSGLSRRPSPREWKILYNMANMQSLVGVCYAGVQGLSDPDCEDYYGMIELQYLEWMGNAAVVQQNNELLNRQCLELQKHLSGNNFRSCFLKGQGTAALYGSLSDMRQSGDIDVWIMPHDIRTIQESRPVINEFVHRSFPDEKGAFVHIGYPIFEDTEVELHYIPTMDGNPRVDRQLKLLFEQRQDECFGNVSELGFAVPEPMVNLLFNLHHVKRHFITSGIGLRHVLDLYFIFKSWNGDAGLTFSLIDKLRLRRFLSGLIWVMNEVLGEVPVDFGVVADERLGRFMLQEIMQGGNFGHYDERLKGVNEMGFWQRWGRYLSVSTVRFCFFPADVIWSYIFRMRIGIWRRFGVEI